MGSSTCRVNGELAGDPDPKLDGGYMKYGTMAVALTALVVAAACGGSDQPVSPDGVTNPNNPVAGARIGTLHTEKDCTNYFGRAGDSCTITKSNLREIAVGSIRHYLPTA